MVRHGSAKPRSPVQIRLPPYNMAGVAELADALDSKSCAFTGVSVRPRPSASFYNDISFGDLSCLVALRFFLYIKNGGLVFIYASLAHESYTFTTISLAPTLLKEFFK